MKKKKKNTLLNILMVLIVSEERYSNLIKIKQQMRFYIKFKST